MKLRGLAHRIGIIELANKVLEILSYRLGKFDMKSKAFSQEEATQMLPLVRRIATDTKACCTLIKRHDKAIYELLGRLDLGTTQDLESIQGEIAEHKLKIESLRTRLNDCSLELKELGCIQDDPDSGIVKFLSVRNGEAVYLAWQLGDEEVLFWHQIEDEFENRKLITADDRVAGNAEH